VEARDEYSRVLSNPGNLIISKELEHILEYGADQVDDADHILKINDQDFVCSVISLVKREDNLRLILEVPSLNVNDLFDVDNFEVVLGSQKIQLDLPFEFVIEHGKRILILEKTEDLEQ